MLNVEPRSCGHRCCDGRATGAASRWHDRRGRGATRPSVRSDHRTVRTAPCPSSPSAPTACATHDARRRTGRPGQGCVDADVHARARHTSAPNTHDRTRCTVSRRLLPGTARAAGSLGDTTAHLSERQRSRRRAPTRIIDAPLEPASSAHRPRASGTQARSAHVPPVDRSSRRTSRAHAPHQRS